MISWRVCRFALAITCVFSVAGLVGCGGGVAMAGVSGTIKMRGQAPNLKGLEIAFLAPNGRLITAPVNADGTYKAVEVPVGEAKISFIYVSPNVAASTEGKGRLPPKGSKGDSITKGPAVEQVRNPIPEFLRDGSTSNLSLNVLSGISNVFDYDVRP